MKLLPKISIVTCTYNGERVIESYLKHIFSQDYPLNKIELILADGGSKDKTLDIIEKYRKKYPKIIKPMRNPKQYSIGKGFGMDIATKKAKGDFIVQLDQDNILIQKDWLRKMITILLENKEITAVQSRLFIPENGSITDKYINAIGIEDPFALHYSLNAQIALHPGKFVYDKKGDFFIYTANKKRFYYAGDNGFVIRRKEFIENGGYTQDIDNLYRMACSDKTYRIAVPANVRLYHQTSTSLKHMLQKRVYYVKHYLLKNITGRDFYWFNIRKNTLGQNLRFFYTILLNLAFLPGLFQGIFMAFKERKLFWLVHPIALFSITAGYIYALLYVAIFRKQKETSI